MSKFYIENRRYKDKLQRRILIEKIIPEDYLQFFEKLEEAIKSGAIKEEEEDNFIKRFNNSRKK